MTTSTIEAGLQQIETEPSPDEQQAPMRWTGAPSGLRGAGVIMGSSVLLDLALGASVAGAVVAAVRRPGQVLRPLVAIGTAAAAAYMLAVRPWYLRWGATDDDLRHALPGDELVPRPMHETTRAIDIRAPVEKVWRRLVQTGTGQGGWHGYDWLESLARLRFHRAQRVLPEPQELHVGDQVLVGPGYGFVVVALKPARALVLQALNPITDRPADVHDPASGDTYAASWAFVLDEQAPCSTRLTVRFRADARSRHGAARLMTHLIELPHFVMEREMLLGIKRRAEQAAAAPARHRPQSQRRQADQTGQDRGRAAGDRRPGAQL